MLAVVVASTALARIQTIPSGVWLKLGIALLALVALVVVLRKVAKMNKIIVAIVTALILSIIGFNWIYQRNEPSWATPVIEPISHFLPTKDSMK